KAVARRPTRRGPARRSWRCRRARSPHCATSCVRGVERLSRTEPTMEPFLLVEQDGPVVTLTMNRPEQRNPLTGNSAVSEFLQAIQRIQDDRRVRCVIITGNGPSFSAGGDMREMQRQQQPEVDEAQIRDDYRNGIQRLPLALFGLEVPVIAAV